MFQEEERHDVVEVLIVKLPMLYAQLLQVHHQEIQQQAHLQAVQLLLNVRIMLQDVHVEKHSHVQLHIQILVVLVLMVLLNVVQNQLLVVLIVKAMLFVLVHHHLQVRQGYVQVVMQIII